MKHILLLILATASLQATAQVRQPPLPSAQRPQTDTLRIVERRGHGTEYGIPDKGYTSLPVLPIIVPEHPWVAEFDADKPASYVVIKRDVCTMPMQDMYDMVGQAPGAVQAQRGHDVRFYGARDGGNLYIIDGMRIMQ